VASATRCFPYVATADVSLFESPRVPPSWSSENDYRFAAAAVDQVIKGVFEAHRANNYGTPLVTVRAVDSSWWEVYSDDSGVHQTLRAKFMDVRPAQHEHPRSSRKPSSAAA